MELYMCWKHNCLEWLLNQMNTFLEQIPLQVGHFFLYLLVITVNWTVPIW